MLGTGFISLPLQYSNDHRTLDVILTLSQRLSHILPPIKGHTVCQAIFAEKTYQGYQLT